LNPSKNNILKNSIASISTNYKKENKKRIESPYRINFRDERSKLIKLSNDIKLDEIEDNSYIESPNKKNFRVKNKDISKDISYSTNLDNSQIKILNKVSNNQRILNNNPTNRNNISNSHQYEDKHNIDFFIKNRIIDSKNYLKKNRNVINYLNNSNNNLIDLNSNNHDVILPSSSEMIRIPIKDISSKYGVNRDGEKRINNVNNSNHEKYNISNYNSNVYNQKYISRENYLNSNILQTRINSYSPIPDKNLNAKLNINYQEINKRPSSIRLPNINNYINKSRNDTSINKRPISMIKSHNDNSIENSRINSYRKKSPYYFNDPKMNKLIEEKNQNSIINKKLKNLVNLSESQVKNYNNNSRINHNNKSNISIDDVEYYEIL
jgi:hypothetical protein